MSIQENVRVDDEFIATWDTHDPDRALALLSDDVVWLDVGIPEPLRDKKAIRTYLQGWFTAFPDLHTVTHHHVVSEDQVAGEIEFSGTNQGPLQMSPGAPKVPATGKKVTGKGTYFLRIKNGKVVEVHTYPDAAGLMTQLGLIPPSTS